MNRIEPIIRGVSSDLENLDPPGRIGLFLLLTVMAAACGPDRTSDKGKQGLDPLRMEVSCFWRRSSISLVRETTRHFQSSPCLRQPVRVKVILSAVFH